MLDSTQAAFVASHYRIVSIEKCTSPFPTEKSVYQDAALLKSIDPSVKVLFYWDTDQAGLSCYDIYAPVLANPSWWLRDDDGLVVYGDPHPLPGLPMIDYTVTAARDWWVSVPLNNSAAATLIDGVFVDGIGSRCPAWSSANISAERCAALIFGKSQMVRQLQDLLTATNGGAVIGNGIDMYPGGPIDHNLYTLNDMNGIMSEHFASFEQVTSAGTLNVNLVAELIALVIDIAAMNKTVVVAFWPGLYSGPSTPDGYFPWPNNTQPNTTAGWRAALVAKHTFAYAAFLTMAAPSVWMQYLGFYNAITQGGIACPDVPESCAAPNPWYPDLYRPLGPPTSAAVRTGNVWTRQFAHATSVLNLDNPDASQINFVSPTAAPTSAPTGSLPVLCVLVWCGVVWCGVHVVWCGVVCTWCGVVWCGVVWCVCVCDLV